MDRGEHWENIYRTKKLTEVSWYEPFPETSFNFIKDLHLPKEARIIDIGGGDSFLADFLLAEGYSNVSVLDISKEALQRAKSRLDERKTEIQWIHADVSEFEPEGKYDLWHDRATFHFLTDEEDIRSYMMTLKASLNPGSHFVIGTFSNKGPEKCSGIDIKQHSTAELIGLFSSDFDVVSCRNVDHETPSGATQNFSFWSFRRKYECSGLT